MVVVMVLSIVFLGYIYQSICVKFERKEYQPIGQMIEIEGHKMHVYSKGQGSPTVVMTVGLGSPSAVVDYYRILEGLSQYIEAIVYERPGYGWSDISKTPRSIEQITKELHLLLKKSEKIPPYILVGHSIGSLEILHFAQKYPDLVAGVVLIDGGSPEYYSTIKFSIAFKIVIHVTRLLTKLGIIRLFGNISTILGINSMKFFSKDMRSRAKATFYSNWFNDNSLQELKFLNRNATFVKSNGLIGDIPLLILSAEKSRERVKGWEKDQDNLLKWSRNSRIEVIQHASHGMHFNNPEVLVKEIIQLLMILSH